MRRIRWGRVAAAIVTCVLVFSLTPWTVQRATTARPATVHRPTGARCETGDALATFAADHPPDGALGRPGRLADLVAIAGCADVTPVPSEAMIPAFRAAMETLRSLEGSYDEPTRTSALAVARLAAEQRRVGGWIDALAWMAVGTEAIGLLDAAAVRAPPGDTTRASLVRIAGDPLDLADVHRWEEWRLRDALRPTDPRAIALGWLHLVRDDPRYIRDKARAADAELRTRAAVLAAAAELGSPRACPSHSVVLEGLAGSDLDVRLLPDRCAILGTWDGGSTVAVVPLDG